METDPLVWMHALRQSQDRLAVIASPLTSQQLRGPSYDTEWNIAQVLSHLGSQAELFEGWLTAAIEGTEPPPRESMQPVWDAWNASDPDEQSRDWLSYNERLVEHFERLSEAQLAGIHLSLFGMELDAPNLVRLRLSEHAVHTWDIADALDPSAEVIPEGVALLIDTLRNSMGRAGKPQGRQLRLAVRTTDPEQRFLLRVDEAVELTETSDPGTENELRIPAEAFLRLVYGRLDPDHTPHHEMTGDVSLDDLRRIFPGA